MALEPACQDMTTSFGAFLGAFELSVRLKLAQAELSAGDSIDQNIATLAGRDKRLFREALTSAVAATVGIPVPEDDLGDKVFAYCSFVNAHHRTPGPEMRFNDVLYRMKVSGELTDPLRVFVTDKEFVKIYVRATVGDRFNAPTIEVLREAGALASYEFPPSCAIKATHGSGQTILRENGEAIDREMIRSWFSLNFYRKNREQNYRTLRPKVIVEPLVFGQAHPPDFKVFCFNGSVRLIYVHFQVGREHRVITYDANWNELPFTVNWPRADGKVERPGNLEAMISTAEALSRPFGLVRIDLYSDGREHMVGEITNCNQSASARIYPKGAEQMLSDIVFA